MIVWYVLTVKLWKTQRNGGTVMKRRLVLFILILIPVLMMPAESQAKKNTFGRWLRKTQMLPEPSKAVQNIAEERFKVDSTSVRLDNESPQPITVRCVYKTPKYFDPSVKGSIHWRTVDYEIDLFPDEQYEQPMRVVFDHVKMVQFPEEVFWGTGLLNKRPGKRIEVNLHRNVVTTFTGQVIDVTPPGAPTYNSSIWHPLTRQTSRLDIYNPWARAVRVSTNYVQGYEVKVSHWIDSRGNEYFRRKIIPANKPEPLTIVSGDIGTYNLPPGSYTLVINRERVNGGWYHLADLKVNVRGDGSVYRTNGERIYGPLVVPRPGDAVSSSAVEIK